jgi:hypothetical protein
MDAAEGLAQVLDFQESQCRIRQRGRDEAGPGRAPRSA